MMVPDRARLVNAARWKMTGFTDLTLSTIRYRFDATWVDDNGPDAIDNQPEWSDVII